MIPYTIERRADTGVNNVTLGIWLLLASEAMLFGALFSAYALLRTAATAWPDGSVVLNLPLGAANSAAQGLMLAAVWRARSASGMAIRAWVGLSSLFALLSLGLLGIEYAAAIARGLVPSVNTFFAMHYTLTGVHALHIIGGVIASVWIIAGARRVPPDLSAGRVRALSLYCAFLAVVWLGIFAVMYVI